MLNLSRYHVREKVSFMRFSDHYDIYDADTEIKVGYAAENLNIGLKLLRLVLNKKLLPSTVEVFNEENQIVFSIKKGPQFIKAHVDVLDGNNNKVGYFVSKFFTIGGAFQVFDVQNNLVAEVKGDWKGWNFKFIGRNLNEIGTVTKKWAGIGKEFFTSADNYFISINEAQPNPAKSILLLAAGLAIDIVFKEKR